MLGGHDAQLRDRSSGLDGVGKAQRSSKDDRISRRASMEVGSTCCSMHLSCRRLLHLDGKIHLQAQPHDVTRLLAASETAPAPRPDSLSISLRVMTTHRATITPRLADRTRRHGRRNHRSGAAIAANAIIWPGSHSFNHGPICLSRQQSINRLSQPPSYLASSAPPFSSAVYQLRSLKRSDTPSNNPGVSLPVIAGGLSPVRSCIPDVAHVCCL